MPKKLLMYTLHDKVAKVCTNPQIHLNEEEAKRYYEEIICKQGIPASCPADFEYNLVGYFDRESGKVEAV